MKVYLTEKEGQIDFFDKFAIDWRNNPVLVDNTDGVWKGNILEFKLNISNINKVLFQTIKYLSKMRIKGESIPYNIILISLNDWCAYVFNSKDYFEEIHKVYYGAASKNNDAFIAKSTPNKIDYSYQEGAYNLLSLLREEKYTPIDLDENCIVGWAERYYRENPKATKGDFLGDDDTSSKTLGEIREPRHFKSLINPYKKKSNEKFKYLMDKLNDRLNKKDLGAFYTPIPYCIKAKELVEIAISRVPIGNDYIILDRCAGTGNLESILSEAQLSHCILSTYEYYEYKVLCERLGEKVRAIIPPIEMEDTYDRGFVKCADAMSKEYLDNPIIKKYLDDEKCTIILYENPPYRDDTSGMTGIKSEGKKINSYVLEQMKINGISKTNELANRFIWSAFKYYLRQENDSYIVFSPIKYWKIDKLINKRFRKGFLFNKKYFHASPSAIACILWENVNENIDEISLEALEINNELAIYSDDMSATRVTNEITKIFDKKIREHAKIKYSCKTDGNFEPNEIGSYYDNEILGYFVGRGFGISNPNLNFNLVRLRFSDNHGFYVTLNNYYKKMIIISIKHYLMFCRDWKENEFICCSTDRGFDYEKDNELLKRAFIFGCLDYYNKCKSQELLVDGKPTIIKNELCFDENTVASKKLATLSLNKDERQLLDLFNRLIGEAKKVPEYNSKYTYGLYQIADDLNTYYKDENDNKVYNHPELNSYLEALRKKTDAYFDKYIKDKLYEYELIK
ncbi:hypothetical protein J6Y73_01170 [bacterium]|nr:hypothetical protein [bacterium]